MRARGHLGVRVASLPLALALAAACGSCGPSRSTVKPDEMSAAAHRREAARERMLAEEDYQRYQPTATAPMGGLAPHDGPRLYPLDVYRFNPTEKAIDDAERHLRHAREHERAAAELERYEAAECKELAPRLRAACPLLGPVAAIDDLPDGVRIRYADATPVAPVLAQMRCHLAFARARAFADVGDCPLYMKGVIIAAAPDGRAIDVRSDDAAVAREIQVRSRTTSR